MSRRCRRTLVGEAGRCVRPDAVRVMQAGFFLLLIVFAANSRYNHRRLCNTCRIDDSVYRCWDCFAMVPMTAEWITKFVGIYGNG